LIGTSALSALDIPFSESEVKLPENQITGLMRVSPPDSLNCPLETNTWLWHDGKNLYLQIEAEIDENFEIGNYTKSDIYPQADFFRIQLITDPKSYYAYGFFAYPFENRIDFIRTPSLGVNKTWNSNYEYSSSFKDTLWTVSMKIPFKDLRFFGDPPYNWKIILARYTRYNKQLFSKPFLITKMGKNYFHKALDIKINHSIEKNKNFYIRPHTIFTYDLKEKETSFDEENVGFDFSFNPSFSTKFKLSFLPDYSDVPMDNVKDIYNSKYAPTFEENRYFFIEDFNAFGVSNTTFYSRYIMQPQYAFKYTGKNEHYSFGVLSTMDKLIEETYTVVNEDSSLTEKTEIINPDDIYNIIAYQPIWQHFRCQFTLMSRMNEDYYDKSLATIRKNYHNEVLHLEPTWEFNRNHFIWIDMNLSYRDVEEDTKKGYYGKIGYSCRNKDFYFSISAQQMQKDYAVDMGKIYEDDFYGWNINTYYSKDINNDIFRELNTTINLSEEIDNQTDILLERYSYLNLELESNYYLKFYFDYQHVKEYFNDKYFNKHRTGFRIVWDKLDWFVLHIGINEIEDIEYQHLFDSFNCLYLQYGLSGIISKYINYGFFADKKIYSDMLEHPQVDDEYWIGNFDLNFNITNKISLNNGLRYNNYESYRYVDNIWRFYSEFIGFFSNFSWEFKRDCHLYFGYKTSLNEIDNSYQEDYQKLYAKISYNF
jgi:hypothetical protein